MLTLEERERRAYIEGRVEEAALLAQAIDGDEALREEVAELKTEASKSEDEIGRYISELDDKGVEIEELENKLAHADDTINELRTRITEAGVDLV
jgi:chromosome segregation ATPase